MQFSAFTENLDILPWGRSWCSLQTWGRGGFSSIALSGRFGQHLHLSAGQADTVLSMNSCGMPAS